MPNRTLAFEIGANVKEVNRAVASFVAGIATMNKAVANLSTKVNSATAGISSDFNRMGTETGALARIFDRDLARAIDRTNVSAIGLGTTIGVLAGNFIKSAIGTIGRLSKEILNINRDFERLSFSLQTLSAVELVEAGQFDSVKSALGAAGEEAENTLLILQDLALYSPFTTREIADGNRLLRVYGFLSDEAETLTTALVDFASGGGLDPEKLDRIQLAIGQIRAEGRLLARDSLQLSQAGVKPLEAISQKTGKTIAELQEMQRLGQISASLAIESIYDWMIEFEGSGERVSDTLNGVISSIKDAAEIGSRDLFKNIFKETLPLLQGIRDTLASYEFRAGIVVIGEILGKTIADALFSVQNSVKGLIDAWNNLDPALRKGIITFVAVGIGATAFLLTIGTITFAISALINPFTVLITAVAALSGAYIAFADRVGVDTKKVASAISSGLSAATKSVGDFANDAIGYIDTVADAFTTAANSAVEWGNNIVSSLAYGITSAVNLVISAVNAIGSAISYLMAPGSPPRFLPDLDKWGKEAAEVYLVGWTQSNYDALNDFGSEMRKILEGLVTTGDISQDGVVPTLLAGRQSIAQAIEDIRATGTITEIVMRQIRTSFGAAGNEATRLLTRYANLASASKIVEAAQRKLSDITTRYSSKLDQLNKKLFAPSNAKQTAEEQTEILGLKRLIATEGVSNERKAAAQARIEEIAVQRQIRLLEDEYSGVESLAKIELDRALALEQSAQDQLNLLIERFNVQSGQIGLFDEQKK